jgi:hypothetical protein
MVIGGYIFKNSRPADDLEGQGDLDVFPGYSI